MDNKGNFASSFAPDVRNVLSSDFDESAVIMSVADRIEYSKTLPAEFSKMIDDNFWDLF